jgi:hypothetical protein
MIGVLVRLQWMSLKGQTVRSIRLLRQPKYLVGFVVGVGWMGLWVLRPLLRSKIALGSAPGNPFGADLLPIFRQLAALAVTFALPIPWLFPWGKLGLPFREAELTMLLQAPLTRRQVIQYGLLKSELGVLISGFVLPLVVGLGGPSARLLMGCGTWLLFEFWHLNGKWRALFLLRQREIPAGLARARRILLTAGLLGFYATLIWALKPFVMQTFRALDGANFQQVTATLRTMTWPPLLKALLAPAWTLTSPTFAGGVAAFAAAAPAVLIAILAQREIVLRSKARFEESSLERATKQEERKSPTRRFARISSRARTRRPFELDGPGPPEVAVVWKNAMRVSRTRWLHAGYFAVALLIVIPVLPAIFPFHKMAYGVLLMFGLTAMIIQPLMTGMSWNNDLRTELAHIELVRTWPVSAHRLVLAEVLSPTILSFASAVVGAAVVLTCFYGTLLHETMTGQPSSLILLPRTGGVLGVTNPVAAVLIFVSFLPLAAAVAFFSSALQNLATLFVPAWMAHSTDRSRGFAALGQRLLVTAGLGLALLLALIPGALLVGAAALIQHWIGIPWTAWAFPLWAVLAAAPQAVIAWLMVQSASGFWEHLDPSQEILDLGR